MKREEEEGGAVCRSGGSRDTWSWSTSRSSYCREGEEEEWKFRSQS